MVKFGVSFWQEEYDFDGLKRAWHEVEDMGYDSAWVYDHLYPMSPKTSKHVLEAWTILSALAVETNHIRLGVLVTCNTYRFPSILAKIATTVDVISGGRLEFGIGAGWVKEEHGAYGISFPDVRTRIEQLAEAIELIKIIWTTEKANFHGKYYTIRDLVAYPKPVQKPYPPIWIGGASDDLLKVVAQHADYSNIASGSEEEYRQKLVTLRNQCLRIGRRFEDIQNTWQGFVMVGERKETRRKALKFKDTRVGKHHLKKISFDQLSNRMILGTPEQCIEKIQRYVSVGVTYFTLNFPFDYDLKATRIFIDKVAPAFK
jgi:F420-dependent oxidoreductase-like protein